MLYQVHILIWKVHKMNYLFDKKTFAYVCIKSLTFIKFVSNCMVSWMFKFFWCHTPNGNKPQWDLAKFGYKTNREIQKLAILLYFCDLVEPLSKVGNFLEKIIKNPPIFTSSFFGNFINFFLEIWEKTEFFSIKNLWLC